MKLQFYWNDLTLEKQKQILSLLGDNQNWDIIPFCTIDLGDDYIEMKSPKQ